jgi:hypothetical protein
MVLIPLMENLSTQQEKQLKVLIYPMLTQGFEADTDTF